MMKFIAILSILQASLSYSHPILSPDESFKVFKTSLLELSPGTPYVEYRFLLVHNDFARVGGRQYPEYSQFDHDYMREKKNRIISELRDGIEIDSTRGTCNIKKVSLEYLERVQINSMLSSPGHLINMVFHCPGRVTNLRNELTSLMTFPTLEEIRMSCRQIKLGYLNDGNIEIPHNLCENQETS